MLKINYILAGLILLCSSIVFAQKCTKDMLDQISNIQGSWHPVVGTSLYQVKKNKINITIICLYDSGKTNADPSYCEVQAVFASPYRPVNGYDVGYKLVAITFSSIDRVLSNIDLLVK